MVTVTSSLPNATSTRKGSTSGSNASSPSSPCTSGSVGWRILQVIIVVLLLENLRRHGARSYCTSTPSSTGTSTKLETSSIKLRNKATETSSSSIADNSDNDVGMDDKYTRPLSDRVPAQGIETILATSATNPPFHFFAYAKKTDFVTESIVKTGIYEKDSTTALIDAIVCQSKITSSRINNQLPHLVLDLGANIGFHSLHMASCGARVVSFEASPDTAWLLRSSAMLNGYWRNRPSPSRNTTLTIVPRGASNITSTGRLSRHPKSPGMTSFAGQSISAFDLQQGEKGTALDVDIPLVRVQDVLHNLQVSPETYHLRFLKMDVEGFELQALQGLDLQQFPFEYITFEFFPTMLIGAGTDPAEFLVYVWKQGYRYLDFLDATAKIDPERYAKVDTGGDTEEAVRAWGQKMVADGEARDGKGYHVNLLARRV